MKVLKFGGSSVAHADAIRATQKIVAASEQPVWVVVSALGGITDLLLEASLAASRKDPEYQEVLNEIEARHLETVKALIPPGNQAAVVGEIKGQINQLESLLEGASLIGEITPKLQDSIVSYGELLSSFLVAAFYRSEGMDAGVTDSREIILTDEHYGSARVQQSATFKAIAELKSAAAGIRVFPGFIAASASGNTTTLGRGGSDFTAALLAAGAKADVLEIWTDVSGMYTANPRTVKQARPIPVISYEEAMELSHFGAKVLYPPTIQPVLERSIPIAIKNTFAPESEGTLIHANGNPEGRTVRGISHVPDIGLLSLEGPGMVGVPGISKRFFQTLSEAGINIVFITQASSEHSICVGISQSQSKQAEKAVNAAFAYEIERGNIHPVVSETGMAIIALVGDQMKKHQGLSGKMFSALGRNNVNIRAIAQGASERNISAVIDHADVKKALNTLHEAFFEEQVKQLNLFVIGVGNVGARLMDQIRRQQELLHEEMQLQLRVVGISNSRKMNFKTSGIDLEAWEEYLGEGEDADLNGFFERVSALNLRNPILVDNTASETVSKTYSKYLTRSISVVTCNKLACSSAFENYSELKLLSRQFGASFLFETNVGAGLPVIDTLKNLVLSGDKVRKIRAVLSGSLNFVFNTYNGEKPFAEVVRQAMAEGYTEPDPRIDLSGSDVMRKILILARESGYALDMEEISNESFLPKKAQTAGSVSEFLQALEAEEDHFAKRYDQANASGARLKYVAVFDSGKASVGLEAIPEGHDFYNLSGSDNIVLFYTDRYPVQPLVIKGAGAGADVTASGLFADIIRVGNK